MSVDTNITLGFELYGLLLDLKCPQAKCQSLILCWLRSCTGMISLRWFQTEMGIKGP